MRCKRCFGPITDTQDDVGLYDDGTEQDIADTAALDTDDVTPTQPILFCDACVAARQHNPPPLDVEALFSPTGPLSRPGFEVRPGQVKLARAIYEAAAHQHHLLAEGPCFTPDALVLADGAYRPIGECTVGMSIETLRGGSHIEAVKRRHYSGPAVALTTSAGFFPVTVTESHKFYVLRRERCVIPSRSNTLCGNACETACPIDVVKPHADRRMSGLPTVKPHTRYRIEVVEAKDLSEDDCLLVRQPREQRGKVVRENAYVELLGLWLAEGHVDGKNQETTRTCLTFSSTERETLAARALELGVELGFTGGIYDRPNNSVRVMIYGRKLAEQIVEDCGELSHAKRLPTWFACLSQQQQILLLTSLFKGDARVNLRPRVAGGTIAEHIRYVTVSLALATGVRDALHGLGVRCQAIREAARTDRNGVSHREAYRIQIPRRFMSLFGFRVETVRRDLKQIEHEENSEVYTLVPISKLTKTTYEGDVCNLTSAGHDSYLTDVGTSKNCGVGKSKAYGVPAAYLASHGKKVLIVTASIALQEQLIKKDLPALQQELADTFGDWSFAIMKGKSNYVCKESLAVADDNGLSADERDDFKRVMAWARSAPAPRTSASASTKSTSTSPAPRKSLPVFRGDKSELDFKPSDQVWSRFTTSSEACPGKKCPQFKECYATQARNAAANADVIVTNYHMLFLNISYGGTLLPHADVVMMDECFPAGTKVGGVPIETLRPGDMVPSFDETTGKLVRRRVVRQFVSVPSGLVRVRIAGKAVVCTPGHPFLTTRGWVPAAQLFVGDVVLAQEAQHEEDMGGDALLGLRNNGRWNGQGDVRREAKGEGVLLSGACGAESAGTTRSHGLCQRDGALGDALGTHAAAQPNAERGDARTYDGLAQSHGAQSKRAWRERQRSDRSASTVGQPAWLADGVRSSDGNAPRHWVSDELQAGHCVPRQQDRDRSGRPEPLFEGPEVAGREEGQAPSFARVDGVEVLQPGCDGTYGGVCPDGLVYNVEVEGTHTYVAEGFVVHNCHEAADIARDLLGFRVSRATFSRYVRDAKKRGATAEAMLLEQAADTLFSTLLKFYDSGHYAVMLRYPAPFPGLGEELLAAAKAYAAACPKSHLIDHALAAATRVCEGLTLRDPNCVYSIEVSEPSNPQMQHRRAAALQARYVQPGPVLEEKLWAAHDSVIAASATITVANSFDYARRELGAPAPAHELAVDTPFNFQQQALLIVPTANTLTPEPNDPRFGEYVAQLLAATIEACDGRTLGLFTSYKGLRDAYQRITRIIAAWPAAKRPRILQQGDAPPGQLAETFKRDVHSVLLGTTSFWTGIDVPGEALTAVVIDKLPFGSPEDPVTMRLSETSRDTFGQHMVPRAILQFRQGVGRLIRAQSDVGAVIIADKRVVTKGYGSRFLRSLPGMARATSTAAIKPFLASRGAA